MIRMKCPTCTRTIGIDEAYVGKPALCPACGSMFTVPAPAVLLEEAPHPPPLAPPPPPAPAPRLPALETVTGPAADPPARPLIPDDEIPLAPDPAHSRKSWALPGEVVGAAPPAAADPWERCEAHLQPLAPLPVPDALGRTAVAEPGTSPERVDLPPPGEEVRDWNFLTLETVGLVPESAPAPTPILPPAPPAAPPAKPVEDELILLPLEDDHPENEPILLPLADEPAPAAAPRESELVGAEALLPPQPESARPLRAEPVADNDTPAVLPAIVEPLPVPAATGVVPPGLVETVVVPTAPPAAAPPGNGVGAPVLVAELVTPAPAPAEELDWGEDVNRVDPRTRERDRARPRKRRRTYGAVSLIPGLDDYYLGLIVLGVIWLLMAVLLIASPRLCMIPIVVGGLIWVSAMFWLNVCVQEADPWWKIPFFIPAVTTPLSFVAHMPGLFVVGFLLTQMWAAFFAAYFRDRALRAFLVSCLAMLMSGMGWAAMPKGSGEDPNPQRAVVRDFGP